MTGLQNRTSLCRGCQKEITFIKTEKGKSMPVDPEPLHIVQRAGGHPYIKPDGKFVYGFIAGDGLDDPDTETIKAYQSHFATCPKAGGFRRK